MGTFLTKYYEILESFKELVIGRLLILIGNETLGHAWCSVKGDQGPPN